MKRCPTCNRTYADETIAFCLADGSLLSAPYDSQAGQQISDSRRTDSPTEIMHPTQEQAPLLPTQDARESAPLLSTIASPTPPITARLENLQASPVIAKPNRTPWVVGGTVALLAVGLAFAIGYKLNGYNKEAPNSNSNTEKTASGPVSSPETITNQELNQRDQNSLRSNANASSDSINVSQSNPTQPRTGANNSTALSRNSPSPPETTDAKPVDYNKIFSPGEVDQKVPVEGVGPGREPA